MIIGMLAVPFDQFISSLLLVFLFGLLFGAVLYHYGRKNRWHEFAYFVCLNSIFCWFTERAESTKSFDNTPHHGLLIAATTRRTRFSMYFAGVATLKLSLTKEKIPYKIYLCNTPVQGKAVIESPLITHLWIFAHGLRHGIDFGESVLYYCEIENYPSRIFIGQYHCNNGGGRALTDYNPPKMCDITNSERKNSDIEEDVNSQLEKMGIEPINLNLRIFLKSLISRR